MNIGLASDVERLALNCVMQVLAKARWLAQLATLLSWYSHGPCFAPTFHFHLSAFPFEEGKLLDNGELGIEDLIVLSIIVRLRHLGSISDLSRLLNGLGLQT